jgi:MFS family permease
MTSYSAIKGKGLAFLALLWFLWFSVMVVRMILGPILPMVEDEFAVHHAQATSLVSLFALGAAISTFLSGVFGGKIGYKKFVLLGLGASVVMFFFIPHVRTFSQFRTLLAILGFVWGTYFPCVIPIVTSHFAPSIWGRTLALQDSGATTSALASPLLAALMLNFISWRQFFYVFAASYVLAGAVFLLLANEVKVEKKLTGSFNTLVRTRTVWIMAAMWMCASGAFWGVYQVTPLYFTKELMLDPHYANTIFGFSRLGGVCFGITMGFIVDRFNLKKSMFVVMFLTGLFTIFIGYKSLTVIKIAMFLQGTAITGFFAIGLMVISRAFTLEERGMAAGLVTTVGSVLGSSLLPYLFGLAGDHLSFRFAMLIFGVVVVLASSLVYFLPDNRKGQGNV